MSLRTCDLHETFSIGPKLLKMQSLMKTEVLSFSPNLVPNGDMHKHLTRSLRAAYSRGNGIIRLSRVDASDLGFIKRKCLMIVCNQLVNHPSETFYRQYSPSIHDIY